MPQSRQSKADNSLPLTDVKIVEKLKETATAKLSEIVRRSAGGEAGWGGYDKAEVIAAKERMYILIFCYDGSNKILNSQPYTDFGRIPDFFGEVTRFLSPDYAVPDSASPSTADSICLVLNRDSNSITR
jgi:hypothetical protein